MGVQIHVSLYYLDDKQLRQVIHTSLNQGECSTECNLV